MEELMFRGPRSLMRARAWLQWLHLFLLSALIVAWMRSSRDSSRHAVGVIIDAWQLQWMLLWLEVVIFGAPSTLRQLGEVCHLDQVGQLGLLSQVSQLARLAQPGQLVHLGQIGRRRQSLRYITQTLAEFALYNANSGGVCVM